MATETIQIELASPLKDFLEARAAEAGCRSVEEYVRSLIDADQQQHLARLEDEVLKGARSGESTPMTPEDWEQLRQRIQTRPAF